MAHLVDQKWDPRNRYGYAGRHEVNRIGLRDEIPNHVRSAVWLRDEGRCDHCLDRSPVEGKWELDHIVPWSAGGPDSSDNLRVLCPRHNQDRSNWRDDAAGRRRPVTWWCLNCYDQDAGWRHYEGVAECPIHRSRPCRVQRGYDADLRLAGTLATWHDRPPVMSGDSLAYCAHCDAPGLTDVVL